MSDLTVNISKTINASIDKVFDAWLDPEILAQFMMPMPGMPQPKTAVDARVGGSYTIIMQVGEDEVPHTGEYLEIQRPNKLVFSWHSPVSAEGSTVTLEFSESGENKTNVELTHIRFLDETTRSNHEGGWGHILENLNTLWAV